MSSEEQKAEIEELRETCRRAQVFRDVNTSKRNPGLFTINGIGATFYGKRDFDSDSSTYVTTHWFVFFFLPIIPMGAYRVSNAGSNSYHIYGRVPLSPFLKKYRWMPLVVLVVLIIYAALTPDSSPVTPPSYNSPTPSPTSEAPSPPAYEPQSSFGTAPAYSSRLLEQQAIERERSELQSLRASLDIRKRQIDDEGAALDQMESYMRQVKSSYTAETAPEDVRARYNSTLEDYNNRVPEYNRALEELKSDSRNYEQRINAFNARVNRYNANR